MASAKLQGNADAVEFCPVPPFFHVLAAATYTLQEEAGEQGCPSRLGTLSLFHVVSDSHDDLKLQQTQFLETCGIFDIKWRPPSSSPLPPLLAQASADGTLSLYNLEVRNSSYLHELTKASISTSMCLSLDWNPHSKQHISVSLSIGGLSEIDIRESHVEVLHHTDAAHSFEAWCVTYDNWKSSILYSGGDDCHFCCWDVRQGLLKPVFREKKTHQMGVTSIQTNPHQENILATGSYDEKLRVWDMRVPEKPLVEKVLELGGGVWKLKWNPHNKAFLTAACMHNGFMIVNIQGGQAFVAMEYKKHESLGYGVDWFKGPLTSAATECVLDNVIEKDQINPVKQEDLVEKSPQTTPLTDLSEHIYSGSRMIRPLPGRLSTVLASCSFYDRSLHIWKADLNS